MRSFRRACALLATSAPLALSVACGDPELKSELVTEGPPEVVQVNVLSETFDPTFQLLGEEATFCREGEQYKVNNVYCPEERDSTGKPIAGARGTEMVTATVPYGPALGYGYIWHTRIIFDELLDTSVEDLVEVDGQVFGTLANTQPVNLTCGGTAVSYDGFYDPSGNHLSYPPGPALVVISNEFVATGSVCQVTVGATVQDKDGNQVPSDQRGPYSFALSPLQLFGVAPSNLAEGVDPATEIEIEFNAPINTATVAGPVTLEDAGGTPVPFTVEAIEGLPNIILIIPDAPLDENTEYVLTIDSGVEDVGGGELTLPEPEVITFTTGAAA
jgi:hypothetical protein